MNELIKIQTELKAPKDKYNSFGKYKYRSAESILEAVKPLCEKYECLLTLSDEVVSIGDRYYVKATATIHKTDKLHHEVTAYAREDEVKKGMDGSQITGTASSYARKYALNGLFCIDDTKDADTDEYHAQTNQPVQNTQPAIDPKHEELVSKVKDKAKERGVPMKEILTRGGVRKVEDMPSAQLQSCLNWLG